jgi:hypothetical protein
MTPPANLYIVAQRVAAGCGTKKETNSDVTDAELAHILMHEIGHAVEFAILGPRAPLDRSRAEGFASWFEIKASDLSSEIKKGSVKATYFSLIKSPITAQKLDNFGGSGTDYAIAALRLLAIEERYGISGVMTIYKKLAKEPITINEAIKQQYGWSSDKLAKEMEGVRNKGV